MTGLISLIANSKRLCYRATCTRVEFVLWLIDLCLYFDDTLFSAACCTGFLFFALWRVYNRNSSFDARVRLTVKEIRIDQHTNPREVFLRIKCAKTDPFRQGHTIRLGLSGKEVCAVKALLLHLHWREGDAAPLFHHTTGLPLTRATLTTRLKTTVGQAGLKGNFSCHCFRIGAATSAAAAGIPDPLKKH